MPSDPLRAVSCSPSLHQRASVRLEHRCVPLDVRHLRGLSADRKVFIQSRRAWRSSQSSRSILMSERYRSTHMSGCPRLNSRTRLDRRTLPRLPFPSSRPVVEGISRQRLTVPRPFTRRGLSDRALQMSQYQSMKTRSDQTLVHDLRELIAALDRRVPRLERDGERDIAHDAQALRRAALKRIAELERSPAAPAMATVARENA